MGTATRNTAAIASAANAISSQVVAALRGMTGIGNSRSAKRRARRRVMMVERPVEALATRRVQRLPRVLRNFGGSRLNRLKEQEAKRSLTRGMQATGPGTSVGNVWSSNKVATPEIGGLMQRIMGTTQNGRLAAVKTLHPAADLGPQRWPDKSANQTLVLQNTDVFTIRAPKLGQDETTWRAQIWITNFVDCPLIVVAESTQTTWINPQGNMNADSCVADVQTDGKAYTFFYSTEWKNTGRHPSTDFQTVRMTARSGTIDVTANATSNQGVIYACDFTPNIALMPYQGGVDLLSLVRESAFNMFKKLTLLDQVPDDYEDLSDEEEDLEELVDKYDKMLFKKDKKTGLFEPPSGGQTGYRLVMQDWPWKPQQVMQASSGAYMAKAEKGLYIPLKHTSDTLPYVDTANEAYLSAVVPHTNDTQTTQMNVLGTEGWTMAAICIDGLSKEATLSIKMITCLEMTARSDSQMAKFVEEAPPLDLAAQRHTRAAMGNLPDGYPSADNVLGGVVNWISGALEKSGVPIVGQVAKAYRNIDAGMGGALTGALDSVF